MSFLDSIRECNRHELARFRPFVIGKTRVGWVRVDLMPHLAAIADAFVVTADAVTFRDALDTPQARTEAFDAAARLLCERIGLPQAKNELYAVSGRWGGEPLMSMDRNWVALMGVPSHGVHVNGWMSRADGPYLWIGRRAPNKSVAPGKLDNMIAGGQPQGLTLMENLIKEADEEAGMPAALAATARPAGVISYVREDEWGLRPDVMFCYDLEVPDGFTPRNRDGEISEFTLMPVTEVAMRVRDTQDFKLNVNLVIIDFMVRHGILSPDTEPDYVEIVRGLRS